MESTNFTCWPERWFSCSARQVFFCAREYLLENFLPDTTGVDIINGYRADDSYFSFAEDFVNNAISVRDLNVAMQLGILGEQIVLISPKSFGRIEFVEYEIADYREYYYKRTERQTGADGLSIA